MRILALYLESDQNWWTLVFTVKNESVRVSRFRMHPSCGTLNEYVLYWYIIHKATLLTTLLTTVQN